MYMVLSVGFTCFRAWGLACWVWGSGFSASQSEPRDPGNMWGLQNDSEGSFVGFCLGPFELPHKALNNPKPSSLKPKPLTLNPKP